MTHTHRLAALALATCLLAACDARVPQPTPTAEVAAAAVTTITPATTSEPTTASQPSPTLAPASGNGLSIYNESIPKVPAKRILIAELDLMLDALRLLDAKKWNGSIDQPLPLSESEFDPAKLRAYIADADADQVVMTMPPDIEPVYLSTDSVQEIRAVLFSAHSEYIDFLKHQGVPQKYIDEMLNVLPADATRIVYHPINKADVPPSAVDGLSTSADNPKDYSRYQLDVYTVDLYNIATDLEPSLILDAVPTSAEAKQQRLKQWRDMAIRKLVYHEMTHVLQRAYINLHVSDANYRTSESAYLWATQSLAPASS